MRFFFTGPRLFGIRPGVSFGASDFGRFTRTSPAGSTGGMTGSFVYVIADQSGRHKIGSSRDPIQRIAQLQTGSADRLSFAYIGATSGVGTNVEFAAHALLARQNVINEWFAVPASIAIGAVIECAGRLGEPIQQVAPEAVPQIIKLASQPDQPPKSPPRLPWFIRWPLAIVGMGAIAAATLVFAFLIKAVAG